MPQSEHVRRDLLWRERMLQDSDSLESSCSVKNEIHFNNLLRSRALFHSWSTTRERSQERNSKLKARPFRKQLVSFSVRMAWRSSGTTNDEMVNNLKRK